MKAPIVIMETTAANMRALAPNVPPVEITDPIDAPPGISGPHGRAWHCDLDANRRHLNVSPENDASLVHWVIEAPWAHPAWHSYSLVLVHLRPLPNGFENLIYLPDATHEMWLHALDPSKDRRQLIAGHHAGHWMRPMNFAAQFIEGRDEEALVRIQNAVSDICTGRLSPDTDFRREWCARFGNNMILP